MIECPVGPEEADMILSPETLDEVHVFLSAAQQAVFGEMSSHEFDTDLHDRLISLMNDVNAARRMVRASQV